MIRSPFRNAKPKLRKCKVCPARFVSKSMAHVVCSPACTIALADLKRLKAAAKREQEERAKTRVQLVNLEPLEYHLKIAEKAFNAYIRARDAHLPCISCGRTDADVWNAGHYISVGANRTLRFNEDNVHKQCARPCNKDKGGNAIKYRIGLIAKIGQERVEALEAWHPTVKMTREFAENVAQEYRAKLKQLKAGE